MQVATKITHFCSDINQFAHFFFNMQEDINSEKYQQEDQNINPNKISTKLEQCIHSIIEKEGFIKYKIDTRCVTTNGGNYVGVLYEVDVNGETKDGHKEINIFVKSVDPGRSNIKCISISDVYRSELFTYNELSKIFNELQDEAHVPLDERYKMVKSYDESNTEAIIMENVARKGFQSGTRMCVVSLEFAEMSIRELAKFHAFSFVLKEKRPEYFNNQIKTIKTPFIFGEQWQEVFQSIIKVTMDHIDGDVKDRVEKFCIGIADKYRRNLVDETTTCCLCHGDYKPNNLLMKMTNGEVSEIIPVDYQMQQYGCLIMDFYYFIFTSTDREFRKAHLSHLKDVYYETLTKFLSYFDIDTKMVYPKKKFESEYTEKMEHGLMISLIMLPLIFPSESDIPDLASEEPLSFKLDDKFTDRIRGIIEDYIEWGFI